MESGSAESKSDIAVRPRIDSKIGMITRGTNEAG